MDSIEDTLTSHRNRLQRSFDGNEKTSLFFFGHPVSNKDCIEMEKDHSNADALSRYPETTLVCDCYKAGMDQLTLSCNGCENGCKLRNQWGKLKKDVDDILPIAMERIKADYPNDTSNNYYLDSISVIDAHVPMTEGAYTGVTVNTNDNQSQEVVAIISDDNDAFTDDDSDRDSLLYPGKQNHSGMMFSTIDRDNDRYISNCASVYKGAWWYNACYRANLNGEYLRGHYSTFGNGITWWKWKGFQYSLKSTKLLIKRH
ncbi:unnamed protein product [Mytilus edulis]|uniref:Fibrinogen C-terminal domain-containing protein n=1 Tax=Mytilus edulis TaxID=6550 RepID=A0A8S3UY04_MYTED|nr:unnamed protein product [Mytilus edulis]